MNHPRVSEIDGLTAPSQPIFILSYGRAGSTLLRYIVDTHPKIVCPAEINLGGLCDSLYHTIYYTIGQLSKTSSGTEREQASLVKTRKIVMSLMGEYTQAKGKIIWCERSPLTIDYLSIIDKLFPDAKYICLYRNCLDFANSFLTLNRFECGSVIAPYIHRNPTSILSAVVEYWLEKSKLIMAFEMEHPRQCIRVKYEDLVTNPNETLDAMFTFLDLKWDASILGAAFSTQHDNGPGDIKVQYTNRIKSDSIGRGVAIPYERIHNPYLSQIDCIQEKLGYWSVESFYEIYREKASPSPAKMVSDSIFVDSEDEVKCFLENASNGFKALNGECKLVVTGQNGGRWICSPQAPNVRSAKKAEEPACVIVVAYETLMSILNHGENPVDAYNEGKMQVTGDLEIAEQFGRALISL